MTPSQLFRLLADETRLRASLLIHQQGELCVCELTAALRISQPKISRHLAQLRNAGVLHDTRRGQWVYYSLQPNLPPWVTAVLDTALQADQPCLQPFLDNLKTMSNRPQCC